MTSTLTLELFAPVIAVVSLVFAWAFWHQVTTGGDGTPAMQKVAGAIHTGARAFIKRQYVTIAILSVAVGAVMFIGHALAGNVQTGIELSSSFLLGALFSGIAGVVSMVVATKANLKTASAATHSLNAALKMSLRSGTVSAIVILALSIIGLGGLFLFYHLYLGIEPAEIPGLIVGYGFGASFVALFAQLGGGIYTKAADVGADLVGKIEAGIPEDDPRNPAVVADLVGDNVGDCAGRGADLFESIVAENVGAMVLGVVLASQFGINGILFPLIIGAIGLIASIGGVLVVRHKGKETPMQSMLKGFWLTTLVTTVALVGCCWWLLNTGTNAWMWFAGAGLVGVCASIAFVYLTDYYTGKDYRPVKSIADASATGHATNIIAGTAIGFESTLLSVLTVCIALFASFWLGGKTGIEHGGLYGTAVATMGMLAAVGYILAMDMFGPITDNAGGIVEMSNSPESVRNVTDELDATGNTTKALTKGYAVGSAALAAFLLFSAYQQEANLTSVDLTKIPVFIGAFLGAVTIFFFTSLTVRAVGRAAGVIVEEVRRQFREKTGIMSGTEEPDYAAAVDIATKSALREMIIPGIVAATAPIIVGLVFKTQGVGAEAVAGFLMVGTIVGMITACYLNNAGGAWDNAKKLIETGYLGGKKSPAHQAAVTGDTVGDPFKDTAGPSLHVLIKLFSTLTLALATLFI